MLSEKDVEIADQWVERYVLEHGRYDFDDVDEEGDTLRYFFRRHSDCAGVVFVVTVREGKLFSIKKEVYLEDSEGDGADEEEWILKGEETHSRKAK